MGGGRWDDDRYKSARADRTKKGVDDFAYSRAVHSGAAPRVVHADLDPKRINGKPFGKLESRDSVDHPESNAIMVCFDVTGSNIARAREAQQKLPNLMALLGKYISDPQIAFAANDDYKVEPEMCIQISDFESDNRIDDHLRDIVLVGNGGGNAGESYDLLLYAAARKTVLDCMEVRGRKGYMFLYADEPLMPHVDMGEVKHVFGDDLERNIPIEEIIEEARRLYHVYLISTVRPEYHAEKQYLDLFGEEYVAILQHPNMICELIASIIGLNEDKITADTAAGDLVAVGVSSHDADVVTTSLAKLSKGKDLAKSSGTLPSTGKVKKADRL